MNNDNIDNRVLLLPCVYCGTIDYYAQLIKHKSIIDIHSNYLRQTASNRMTIISSDGVQNLIIPVEKHTYHTPVNEILISNHSDWKTQHLRALKAAYRSSPFYQYYIDDIEGVFNQEISSLVEFNIELQKKILSLLYYDINFTLSTRYIKSEEKWIIDSRYLLTSQKKSVYLQGDMESVYHQVFESKLGFIPNVSILDLLFNLGPEGRIYLMDKGRPACFISPDGVNKNPNIIGLKG